MARISIGAVSAVVRPCVRTGSRRRNVVNAAGRPSARTESRRRTAKNAAGQPSASTGSRSGVAESVAGRPSASTASRSRTAESAAGRLPPQRPRPPRALWGKLTGALPSARALPRRMARTPSRMTRRIGVRAVLHRRCRIGTARPRTGTTVATWRPRRRPRPCSRLDAPRLGTAPTMPRRVAPSASARLRPTAAKTRPVPPRSGAAPHRHSRWRRCRWARWRRRPLRRRRR